MNPQDLEKSLKKGTKKVTIPGLGILHQILMDNPLDLPLEEDKKKDGPKIIVDTIRATLTEDTTIISAKKIELNF